MLKTKSATVILERKNLDTKKLNLGCGPIQPDGWINIDGSNRAILASKFSLLDKILCKLGILAHTEFSSKTTVHDLFKPLPYKDDSVAAIYAGELWEHFEYSDAERLTGECFRVLEPGGVLRVCVPDGVEFWTNYLDKFNSEMEKSKEQRSAKPLREHIQMYFNEICTRKSLFKSMGHTHKWQYDEIQLIDLLESKGFKSVERKKFHESNISDVKLVERSDFLIVEGVKP